MVSLSEFRYMDFVLWKMQCGVHWKKGVKVNIYRDFFLQRGLIPIKSV